jgi:hypothetical protein
MFIGAIALLAVLVVRLVTRGRDGGRSVGLTVAVAAAFVAAAVALTLGAGGGGSTAARVSFVEPLEGSTVSSPVRVVLAASGVRLEPAGSVRARAGHLHLMVDTACVAAHRPIPADPQRVHLGAGQTETVLGLPAGRHALCLQLGDGAHSAQGASAEVSILVRP